MCPFVERPLGFDQSRPASRRSGLRPFGTHFGFYWRRWTKTWRSVATVMNALRPGLRPHRQHPCSMQVVFFSRNLFVHAGSVLESSVRSRAICSEPAVTFSKSRLFRRYLVYMFAAARRQQRTEAVDTCRQYSVERVVYLNLPRNFDGSVAYSEQPRAAVSAMVTLRSQLFGHPSFFDSTSIVNVLFFQQIVNVLVQFFVQIRVGAVFCLLLVGHEI